MRTVSTAHVLVLALLLACAAGCGGDDDGGDGGDATDDALPLPDGGAVLPDAQPTPESIIGKPCTGEGQGDCPASYTCQALQGGSFCSKVCTPGTAGNNLCNQDHEGPGLALCLTGVDTNMDAMADYFICGILCEDTSIGQCDADVCDGTCPYDQTCTAPVRNQESEEVGKACENP